MDQLELRDEVYVRSELLNAVLSNRDDRVITKPLEVSTYLVTKKEVYKEALGTLFYHVNFTGNVSKYKRGDLIKVEDIKTFIEEFFSTKEISENGAIQKILNEED